MAGIRICTPDDLPTVARLFQAAFRNPARPPPRSLEACLRQIFFEHPWYERELSSRVYVGRDGAVRGFIGAVPMRMRFGTRQIRAVVPTSLVVERPAEDPLAGATLVRSFLTGPQDISITETTNHRAEGMWQRLGAVPIASESMEWVRVFRPAAFALALARARSPAAGLLRPLAGAIDVLAAAAMRRGWKGTERPVHRPPLASQPPAHHARDAGDAELFAIVRDFTRDYALHPAWEPACLDWQLKHAAENRGRGTLFRRIVLGRDGAPLGCYLYHGRRHGIAWVLQVLARADTAGPVVDSLFAHAQDQDCVAVKGRTQARLLDALQRRQCIFFRRSSAMVHSRDLDLLAAVRAGDAITTGLAGETWMRLIGDRFA